MAVNGIKCIQDESSDEPFLIVDIQINGNSMTLRTNDIYVWKKNEWDEFYECVKNRRNERFELFFDEDNYICANYEDAKLIICIGDLDHYNSSIFIPQELYEDLNKAMTEFIVSHT